MPDYTLTITIPNITAQKATAIRDRITARLNADVDVDVSNTTMARNTQPYRVIGVDTATSQVFKDTVEATDPQDATDKAVGSSTTRVVAIVQPVAAP